MKPLLLAAISLALLAWLPARADMAGHNMDHAGTGQHTPAMPWSVGTVKKVNTAAGKVTISHGPLKNLGMPAMTMIFRVKDPSWLGKMKPGEHIRFVADEVQGNLTVTRYERAE